MADDPPPEQPPPNPPTPAGTATLTLPDGRALPLPLLSDAAGALFLDISKLYGTARLCTLDPGYASTAACASSITFIDGDKGILLYRGVPAEDLATHGDWLDAAFLVLHGDLPTSAQKAAFDREITTHTLVNETIINFFRGFRPDAPPMAILTGVVGALSSFYKSAENIRDPAQRLRSAMRLIAKLPTLAALAHRTSRGLPIMYPKNAHSYAERFLYLMFASPTEPFDVDPVAARALEALLILHLDHEQAASTSTVRTAGSSQANPFACVAAGIASLWGPAHGGANEAVMRMLEAIGSPDNIDSAIARAKDRSDPFRLQGFGHRVYKTLDPRAVVMKRMAHDLLAHLGRTDDALLKTAVALEAAVVDDPYFVQRGLYPNVDFYSGIVLRALGFPVSMYTAVFAVARSVGWVAQWREMASEPVPRIARPRQLYSGQTRRPFVPEAERAGGGGVAGEAARRADGARRAVLDKNMSMKVNASLTR
jgi:citrate synthase